MKKSIYICLFIVLFGAGFSFAQAENTSFYGEDLVSIVNMKGNWKYSIGDDKNWAELTYNDSDWETVYVPKSIEDNGFYDYNGYMWYRKSFQFTASCKQKYLYLYLGYIDDVDEVFINGQKVGASGSFPPRFKTAYNIPRMYPVPVELLNKDQKNVIAIRVYDMIDKGGILSGDHIGLFESSYQEKMEINFTGYWDFEIPNRIDKNYKGCKTYRENKIFVPGFWESRGYNNYDGGAKYTKSFQYNGELYGVEKALILGKIDDTDEVRLNGHLLRWIKGKTGTRYDWQGHYAKIRVYEIPERYLRKGNNVVEVIVNDTGGPGGMYAGPYGITTLAKGKSLLQLESSRYKQQRRSFWDLIFD
jgi:sialate O-acetylesterase